MALRRHTTVVRESSRPLSRVACGIAAGVAIALMLASGVVHGDWTGRWSNLDELCAQATGRLHQLPMTLGDWHGQDGELDQRTLERAPMSGYLFRRYQNRVTGEEITVFLVCGRSGPVSVHTPDVCYRGAGYEQIGANARCEVALVQGSAEFWMGEFHKARSPVAGRLRILWAWSSDGAWQAPDKPRMQFARQGCLHKLYIVSSAAADRPFAADAGTQEFIKRLIPQLEATLFERPDRHG
jgi:hypothetical protein